MPALERLSRLAAHVLAAPYGLVLLFEHGALPTVVHHGFSSLQSGAVDTFCSKLATLRHPANEVPWLLDVRSEPLLASTVLVSHSPGVRSCVCVPLLASDGSHFGLLCVLDTQTRAVLDPEERTALLDLAATTVEHLETRVLRMRNGSYEPDPLVLATLHTPPESLLHAIFYSSPQAIMLINADLTIRAHNPRAAEIARTIWRRTIRNGDSAYLYLNPWHIVPFTQYVQEAFQGRTVSSMGNARGIDETEYWFETAYIPMFDRNGTVTSVCLHTTDITERQRAASALARSETRFRTMVQHASDIISLIDANGIIRYQSPSAQRILGYAPEEFIGTNALDIVLPEDFSHTARALQNALKQPGIAPPVAFRARHANGSLVYLEAISTNLLDDDAFGHLVVTTRDVTERQHNREQLLMLQSSVQHIAEAIIITEATVDWFEARIVFVNAGFEALTDYSATEMIGQTPRLFQANEADPEMRARLCATLEQGRSFQGEMTLRRRDGSTAIVDWSVNPVHDRDGAISHFVSVQHDISERKQAEHLADDQRRLLEMVVENRPLPDILSQLVQMFRRQHPHVACAVVMRAGDNAAHIVRSDEPGTVAPHYAVINVCACLEQLWEHHEPTSLCSLLADCTDNCCTDLIGNRAAQFCVSVPIISGQNDVVGAFLFCQDDREPPLHSYDLMTTVSRLAAVAIERRQLIDQLEHHAYHDLLTRLPNRLLFEQRFQQALDDASASGWLVALLFIDLDRFKQINDSLGHDIGDQLLEQVARRMERSVGAHNTLARLGGDEFACIMPQLNDPILAMDLAQRILAIFNEPFTILDHQLFLTANIGISIYPHNGTDIHTLQRNADIAMYRIKRRGVSGFQYFTSDMNVTLRDPLLEMVAIEEYLRKASIFEELRLHYQPQFRLSDNRLVGVEALLRWEHPTLGMIPPGKFISVAERTGLIRPIGQWVLRQACEQAVAWQRAGYAPFTVAVNVSAEQFAEAGFVEMVERILRESGLEPRWLEVELTESLMLSGFEMTTRHIADLKRLGVSIALDDFGTGHAALVNLQRITLDHLKIDKSFIHDLRFPDKSSQQAIDLIQTIVTMAHKLNLQTVVEGIETKQQAALVRRLGCTRAQGYWFGIPMPASEFESSFRERLNRPSDV